MIVKLVKAIASSFYWVKANSSLWDDKDEEALKYLEKSIRIISKETLDYTLLKGFIYFRKRRYDDAVSVMKTALDKIESNKKLAKDDKLYLTAHATDVINFSIVHGGIDMDLMPVDLSFDINKVREIYKRRYAVILEGRSISNRRREN